MPEPRRHRSAAHPIAESQHAGVVVEYEVPFIWLAARQGWHLHPFGRCPGWLGGSCEVEQVTGIGGVDHDVDGAAEDRGASQPELAGLLRTRRLDRLEHLVAH